MDVPHGAPSSAISFAEQVRRDVSPALQIFLNGEGELLAINQSGRRFIAADGVPQWNDFVIPDDLNRWCKLLKFSASQQVPVSGCFSLVRFDKAVRRFILRAELRYGSNGAFVGQIVSGMDITDLDPPGQAVISDSTETERTAPDVWSAAQTWHDELVSIATVIAGCADTLPDILSGPLTEEQRVLLSSLHQATDSLRNKVCDLGNRARMDQGPAHV